MPSNGVTDKVAKKTDKYKWFKNTMVVVVLIGVFWLGLLIGNGTIAIGPDAVFRKSVQKNAPKDLDYSSVETVYDKLRENFDGQLDADKLTDGLKKGLVNAAGDPYTEYFTTKEAKNFDDELNGCLDGVGAILGKDANGNIIIISPISGFPAEKAGLKSQDIIVKIDGKSTQGYTIDDAVSKIRGKVGTTVKLDVIRNKNEALTFEVTREHVCVPSVESKIVGNNVGYIKARIFSDDTAELARKAIEDFKQKKVNGIVLDLRGNPGGLLPAAVDLSNLWLKPNQTVLTERRGGQVTKTYTSSDNPIADGMPTVVLIDGGSASASEITAGALRDNDAAYLIGEKSFGKGSVQQVLTLGGGAALKVTIARWYTPDGKNIDKQGITPDKTVKLSDADAKAGKDPQLDAAINYINE